MGHEDKIPGIFNSISLPVLLIDRSYTVVAVNSASIAHLRRPEGDVIGRPCFALMHDRPVPCWRSEESSPLGRHPCPVQEAFETRERARAIHKHRISGQVVVEEVVATPLVEGSNQIDYVIEEFRDITDLLELNQSILTVCHSCERIRGPASRWLPLERYIADHTGAEFSHSLCPACFRKLHPGEPYPES